MYLCFVWISEPNATVSLYINWSVYNPDGVYCAAQSLNTIRGILSVLRREGPGSIPGQSMWDVVDEMAIGQDYLRVIRFSPASIIPPMLRTRHLHFALTNKTKGRGLGTFQKAMLYGKSGTTG